MRVPYISVAVVENLALFRLGVCQALASSKLCRLVGEGAHFTDALSIARKEKPEIMLIDADLPGGDIDDITQITRVSSATKFIIMASSTSEEGLFASFKAGARGYVEKGLGAVQLVDVVQQVNNGSIYTDPNFACHVLFKQCGATGANSGDKFSLLTARERNILILVAKGWTNKEIAISCKIAEKTVKHYMTGILQKLEARNRVEAALIMQKMLMQDAELTYSN